MPDPGEGADEDDSASAEDGSGDARTDPQGSNPTDGTPGEKRTGAPDNEGAGGVDEPVAPGGEPGTSQRDRGGTGPGTGEDADRSPETATDDRRSEQGPERPRPEHPDRDQTESLLTAVKDVVTTAATVAIIGVVLFAVSGVWPPLVAVESGSMEPHMYKGDLVFIVDEQRYVPQEATAGVVTHQTGQQTGYWSFGDYGNVVVYLPHVETPSGEFRNRGGTPIIHRAQFYVQDGEKWVDDANPKYLGPVDECSDVETCPAEHAGFITKGDNNPRYDQVAGRSAVVRPAWVRGTAKVRIPWLGCVRLQLSGDGCF